MSIYKHIKIPNLLLALGLLLVSVSGLCRALNCPQLDKIENMERMKSGLLQKSETNAFRIYFTSGNDLFSISQKSLSNFLNHPSASLIEMRESPTELTCYYFRKGLFWSDFNPYSPSGSSRYELDLIDFTMKNGFILNVYNEPTKLEKIKSFLHKLKP